MIKIKVYNEVKEYETKQQAIEEVTSWLVWSEGSEQQRYATILRQLFNGETYCTDED